jgi:hypothetical protein
MHSHDGRKMLVRSTMGGKHWRRTSVSLPKLARLLLESWLSAGSGARSSLTLSYPGKSQKTEQN